MFCDHFNHDPHGVLNSDRYLEPPEGDEKVQKLLERRREIEYEIGARERQIEGIDAELEERGYGR
ncbi:hypothetical protein [Merdimmobilis hominis]|uniref:hypothetical protein n=1 Tax=Merdimmobilis hominis TaxID=2897707 RepID=UPI0032D4C953